MLDLPRWKKALVTVVCGLGLVGAIPTVYMSLGKQAPEWLPGEQVSLGLDLRGGSHLALQIDFDRYFHEQLEQLRDDIRNSLREPSAEEKQEAASDESVSGRIGYLGGFKIESDHVSFQLRRPEDAVAAKQRIREGRPDLYVDYSDEGIFSVKFSDERLKEMRKQVMQQSLEIVRRRVDETGTKEPIIQRQGDDRIIVQVPGLSDPSEIKRLLGKTAKLTFHLMDETAPIVTNQVGLVAPDSMRLEDYRKTGAGQERYYIVKKRVMLSGESLVDASPTVNQAEPVVSFRFDNEGAKRFASITRDNVGKPFAIVLDNQVVSAPVIREPILGGSGVISGNFTVQEASDLALLLRAGALPAPLNIVEERTVGPSLGADSIAAGKVAIIVGFILVIGFMLLTYGRFGMYSNIALLFNIVLIVSVLAFIGATLTLPGIAGIVLTMGMAVDANVLIFERIREEIRNGKSPISAIDHGFSQAFGTILDSNLTTLIAALMLFMFGAGPVKGFAVTLTIGIMVSMFSAILVTRWLIASWMRRARPKVIPI